MEGRISLLLVPFIIGQLTTRQVAAVSGVDHRLVKPRMGALRRMEIIRWVQDVADPVGGYDVGVYELVLP